MAGQQAIASITAVASLGPASVFAGDDSDPWLYPAEIINYPSIMAADLDTFPFDGRRMSFLATWSDQCRKYGTMAAGSGRLFCQDDLTQRLTELNYAVKTNPLMSPRNDIPLPEQAYHLFYGREVGSMNCGLHFAGASGSKSREFSDSIPEDAYTRKAEFGAWSADAGISAIIGDNIYFQTAVGYTRISFFSRFELSGTDPLYWEKVEGRDAGSVRLNFRAFYGLSDRVSLVPSMSYYRFSIGYDASYGDTIHTPGSVYNGVGGLYQKNVFAGSLGAEYRASRGVKLIGGIVLEYTGTDISDSGNVWLRNKSTSLIFRSQSSGNLVFPGFQMGLEAELARWLVLRAGSSKRISRLKIKNEYRNNLSVTETVQSGTEYEMQFGLGFRFGRLTIDAQLNDNLPFNGGYLLSGNAEEPFSRLSLTYVY